MDNDVDSFGCCYGCVILIVVLALAVLILVALFGS